MGLLLSEVYNSLSGFFIEIVVSNLFPISILIPFFLFGSVRKRHTLKHSEQAQGQTGTIKLDYVCILYHPVHRSFCFRTKQPRACFKGNSPLHISSAKAGVYAKFLNELPFLHKNFYLSSQIFRKTFFVTAQTAFPHCTFQVITAHFAHHCTLNQALKQPY